MNPILESRLGDLAELCRTYRVRSLEVFGSAASEGHFDSHKSDLDFLVEFLPLQPGEYADAYFGLLETLERLFDRHVDLVSSRAIKNPFFLESVNRSRRVVYAA